MKKYLVVASLLINFIFLVLIIRHFVNAPVLPTSKKLTYWMHRDELFSKLPVDSGAIIFLGDSHTQQFELAELFHNLKVKNRGINFDTVEGLLNRLDPVINSKPSKVFIQIGANDLVGMETIEHVKNEIITLLNRIKLSCPTTLIYLESVMPNKLSLSKIVALNKLLPNVASSLKVTYIDLNPYFLDDGLKKQYDSGDLVHLNGLGYLKLTSILSKYVN